MLSSSFVAGAQSSLSVGTAKLRMGANADALGRSGGGALTKDSVAARKCVSVA